MLCLRLYLEQCLAHSGQQIIFKIALILSAEGQQRSPLAMRNLNEDSAVSQTVILKGRALLLSKEQGCI